MWVKPTFKFETKMENEKITPRLRLRGFLYTLLCQVIGALFFHFQFLPNILVRNFSNTKPGFCPGSFNFFSYIRKKDDGFRLIKIFERCK
jgi:hypothetical protein